MTADEIAQLLSTPDAFKAWLDKHGDSDFIGEAREIHECPIANFLNHNGAEAAEAFGIFVWSGTDGEPCIEIPSWTSAFINTVDCRTPKRLSAGQCKAILAELGL